MFLRKHLLGYCFVLSLLLFPLESTATAFFDNQQKQSIGHYFKLDQIVILNENAASKGTITLGKDHRNGEQFLKLQYSKAVELDGKNRVQIFTIGHYSKHVAVNSGSPCHSKKQQAFSFSHPQLGDFQICASQNASNKNLISAFVRPTTNNRHPQLEIQYSGTVTELMSLLKSMQAYQ